MKIRILFSLFAFPFFFSQGALACRVKKPLTEELKNQADMVFIGKAVSYTPRSKATPQRPAIIRFQIEKTISGPEHQEIEVYWSNETFGESSSLKEFKKSYGKRTRVGLTKINDSAKDPSFQDKPWVLQGPCTAPYLWKEN